MRGVAYALGARESPPADAIVLPSFEEVKADKHAFALATRIIHQETNPLNAKPAGAVPRPPGRRLPTRRRCRSARRTWTGSTACPTPAGRTRCTGARRSRRSRPSRTRSRSCAAASAAARSARSRRTRGGSSSRGRRSRSWTSCRRMGQDPEFSGIVSDIGGPTANMYQMRCTRPEVEAKCKRLSCVHPKVCKLLGTDHGPLVDLMRESREVPGRRQGPRRLGHPDGPGPEVARVPATSWPRTTSAATSRSPPSTPTPNVLAPDEEARRSTTSAASPTPSRRPAAGRASKQYLVPYFIASHPGSDLNAMIDLALFLKRNGYRPDQVQDFIPAPFDIATCMYYTGLDPFTGRGGLHRQGLRDRKLQRALLQFFKPENYFEVREALLEGRPAGPDRLGLRLPDPGQSAQGSPAGTDGEGEPVAGRGEVRPPDPESRIQQGLPAGRKTARRQDKKRKRKGGGSGPRP